MRRVAEQGFQRVNQTIYFALTELCKGRDPSFRPARLAVEAGTAVDSMRTQVEEALARL